MQLLFLLKLMKHKKSVSLGRRSSLPHLDELMNLIYPRLKSSPEMMTFVLAKFTICK